MREDWRLVTLGEVTLRKSNIKWDKISDTKEYIDLSSVDRYELKILDTSEVDSSNAPSRAKQVVKSGDVIFGTTRPTLKRVAIIPEYYDDQVCSTGYTVLRPNSDYIITKYIYFMLQSEAFMDKMAELQRGTSYPAVTDKDVKGFSFFLPPLPEQQRIVEILDEAFEAIDQAKANVERNIQNAEELFQSKLNEVFSKRGEGWEEKRLSEICKEIFAGGDKPKEKFSKTKTEEYKVPVIANAVKDNGLYGYTDKARVTENAITVAARGSGTGHTEFRDYPFLPIVRLIVLIPDSNFVDAEFLMFALKNITITRSGSAIPQLTVPMMKEYSFSLPSVSAQKKLVEMLNELQSNISEMIEQMDAKLLAMEELKKSILQKAFSGELTGGEPGFAGLVDERDGLVAKAAEPEVEYDAEG